MPAHSTVHPALRPSVAPRPSRERARRGREESLGQRLLRRLRDLGIMAVVGPTVGVLAVVAIHVALGPQLDAEADAARAREEQRALAILEDRPQPGTRPVAPFVPPAAVAPPAPAEPPRLTAADFRTYEPTPDARRMADWVVARRDNGKLPFIVLDKRDARLYVFDVGGHLLDQTPVLLGSAHGDDTYPGIGDVPIPEVKPYQRTTAAGRFVTRPGLDADHTDVVWLDYDAALAMHRVINKVKAERRLQRLASANPKVRRVSWGCINIPFAFFDSYISPVFGKRSGVTYVIPERKSFEEVFEKGSATPSATVADASVPMAPRDIANR
jgi:hypothetical protein